MWGKYNIWFIPTILNGQAQRVPNERGSLLPYHERCIVGIGANIFRTD